MFNFNYLQYSYVTTVFEKKKKTTQKYGITHLKEWPFCGKVYQMKIKSIAIGYTNLNI